MEIKNEKYQLITYGNELKVKVDGMMKQEDHVSFLKDYRTIIASMPRKEVIEVDCTSMTVVFQSLLDGIVELLKMYQKDFKQIRVINLKKNILLRRQIERTAKEIDLNYTITEV